MTKMLKCNSGHETPHSHWVCPVCYENECDRLKGALEEIKKGEGAFSIDPLTHASNTIESMKEIATKALIYQKGEGG